MYLKVHKAYRLVVAVCDSEIMGKKFEEGNKVLEISESFYKGEQLSDDEMEGRMTDLAKEDATFNIAGEKAIKLALNLGMIRKGGVKKVNGVPFALILL